MSNAEAIYLSLLHTLIPMVAVLISQVFRYYSIDEDINQELLIKAQKRIIEVEMLKKKAEEGLSDKECKYCESKIPHNAKFCSFCGTSQ